MTLKELYWSKGYSYYPTDKDTHHKYLETYSNLLGKWEHAAINIMEVGTWKGGSMKLFEEYFTNATILGYDIVAPSIPLSRATVTVKDFYTDVKTEDLPNLTIAIDDGPHGVRDQVKFFEIVWPKIIIGGLLIIEDVRPGFKSFFDSLAPYILIENFPPTDEDDDRLLIFKKHV